MAGKENLVPQNKRTKEEQSEIARMGGKASGEARRRKRDAKKAAEFLLNLPAKGVVAENLTKVLDVEEEDQTNMLAIMARMFLKANAGDVNAARFLIETAGGSARNQLEKERLSLEKKRLELEEKKYDALMGEGEKTAAVDDWVSAVLEADKDKEENDG